MLFFNDVKDFIIRNSIVGTWVLRIGLLMKSILNKLILYEGKVLAISICLIGWPNRRIIEEDLTTGPLLWRETILSYVVIGLDYIYKSSANLSREGVGDKNDNPAFRISRCICKWQGIEIRLYRRHDDLID